MDKKQNCVFNFMGQNQNIYSYHTMELSLKITYREYQLLMNRLRDYRGYAGKTKSTYYIWYCTDNYWKERGIRIQTVKIDGDYPYFKLQLVVNPRLVLGDFTYTGIFENTLPNINRFIQLLDEAIMELGFKHLTAKDFMLDRLDLCTNVNVGSEKLADLYIQLMKRGRVDYGQFKEKTYYNRVSKRNLTYPNAVQLDTGSYSLTIYHKARQMEALDYFQNTPPEAIGLLRFELNCNKSKLRYIKDKYYLDSLQSFLHAMSNIGYQELQYYFNAVFQSGNYMTLNMALEHIKNNCRSKDVAELSEFICCVSRARSLSNVIHTYQLNGRNFKKILKKLTAINCNPVTIPARWFEEETVLQSIPLLTELQ